MSLFNQQVRKLDLLHRMYKVHGKLNRADWKYGKGRGSQATNPRFKYASDFSKQHIDQCRNRKFSYYPLS